MSHQNTGEPEGPGERGNRSTVAVASLGKRLCSRCGTLNDVVANELLCSLCGFIEPVGMDVAKHLRQPHKKKKSSGWASLWSSAPSKHCNCPCPPSCGCCPPPASRKSSSKKHPALALPLPEAPS